MMIDFSDEACQVTRNCVYAECRIINCRMKVQKEMLLVDDVDNKEYLTGLFNSMYDELPPTKTKEKEIIKISVYNVVIHLTITLCDR